MPLETYVDIVLSICDIPVHKYDFLQILRLNVAHFSVISHRLLILRALSPKIFQIPHRGAARALLAVFRVQEFAAFSKFGQWQGNYGEAAYG